MPTATSFTALGRGNGFPFCPFKVDVSGYDNWVTLGGVSSGSASSAEINTSLARCMKLYWNLSSATASFTANISSSSPAINYNINKDLSNHEYEITPEPKERICEGITQPAVSSTTMTEAEYTETSGAGCGTQGIFKIIPVRMYNGSTSDISKFVGYGYGSTNLFNGSAGGGHLEGIASANARVKVASYLDGNTESGSIVTPGSGETFFYDRTASILNLDGMPFRSFSEATASSVVPSNFSKTLSSSANSASASGTFSFGGTSDSVAGSVTIPEDFDFDFYTY